MQKVNSDYLKNKILFRLNDNLFKQNLPKIGDSKFHSKQNCFLATTASQGFNLSQKKSKRLFNMPKRFKKHNNKVEQNLNKTSTQFHPVISKTCSNSFYKPSSSKTQLPIHNKENIPVKSRSKISLEEQPKNKYLQPKTLQGIQKHFQEKYTKMQQQFMINQQKQQLMKNFHRRDSKQEISALFNQNKHLYMLSRFTLLQLKSYYCAILNFAKGDTRKFKYAFEIMLNLANVTVRQNIIAECLKDLLHGGISFAKFLKTFTNIQEKLRKQTIIDYFEILLEQIKVTEITYEDLVRTFQGRMKRQIANELTELLYEKLDKQFSQSITKKQIHTLCYENENFCTKFYALNHQNMLSNKFNSYDEY